MRSVSRLLALALLLMLLPGRADAGTAWKEEVVGKLIGAAFSTTADLDRDGRPEILVSSFGKVAGFGPAAGGTVAIYKAKRSGGWSRTDLVVPGDGIQFPNEPTITDVDGDRLVDVIVPGGFFICGVCGSLSWWQQRPGNKWVRHDIVPVGNPLFFHGAQVVDIDGDGKRDLVTVGETAGSATTMYFPGTGKGFSTIPRPIGEGLGALPVVTDVDGDKDLDIASAQYFSRNGSFAWLENLGGVFVKHVIAADLGGAIQLSRVPGIGWVGSNHTNTTSGPPGTATSGLYLLTPGPNPRLPWATRLISTGIVSRSDTGLGQQQGAPGVFGWGDIDGDRDTDLAVSGDGDRRLFVLRQMSPGSFRTEVVADQRGQAGGGKILGRSVLFSSYDAGLVALYRKS